MHHEVSITVKFAAFMCGKQTLLFSSGSVPLVVEVWDREKDKAQSNILGVVQLVLLNVLQEQRARAVVSSDFLLQGTRVSLRTSNITPVIVVTKPFQHWCQSEVFFFSEP